MARRLNVDAATVMLLRLDEPSGGNPIDLGPNALVFTNYGTTAVSVTDMPFTFARQFVAGSSQYITTPQSSVWKPVRASWGLWVKVNTIVPGVGQHFVSTRGPSTWGQWLGINTSGYLEAAFMAAGGYPTLTDTTVPFATGIWTRLDITYDGTLIRLYKNAIEVMQAAASGDLTYDSTVPFTFGRDPRYNDKYFDGQLADFRLDNRARAPWEIYNTVAAVSDPQIGFEVEAGSIAVYNFNNALEGATVYDDTGNHNGSVVGSVSLVDSPISGKARSFNGNAVNRIEIPHNTAFNFDQDLSIEVWITLSVIDGNYRAILGKGSSSPDPWLSWMVGPSGSSHSYCYITTNTSNYLIGSTSGNQLSANILYYLALTFDRTNKIPRIYFNGSDKTTGITETGTYAGGNNTSVLKINVSGDSNDYPLLGRIHAVRWSNYVKTPKEIYDYYNGSNVKEIG